MISFPSFTFTRTCILYHTCPGQVRSASPYHVMSIICTFTSCIHVCAHYACTYIYMCDVKDIESYSHKVSTCVGCHVVQWKHCMTIAVSLASLGCSPHTPPCRRMSRLSSRTLSRTSWRHWRRLSTWTPSGSSSWSTTRRKIDRRTIQSHQRRMCLPLSLSPSGPHPPPSLVVSPDPSN